MTVNLTGAEIDDLQMMISATLDSYKDGHCSRDEARTSLADVIYAAAAGRPGFMDVVRSRIALRR